MMLADAKDVEANLIGKFDFCDEFPHALRHHLRVIGSAGIGFAERVESQFHVRNITPWSRRALASARFGRYPSGVDYRAQMQAALGNAFTIERELAGVGRSNVFVAEELALGRRVVIKMLPKSQATDASLERFRREISIAARLQHPHLVPLLTAGRIDSSGVLWFSMPFVEGESLRDVLQRRGALPLGAATRLMREIALALAYAHRRGVVHRDLKPDNVLLSDGVAMITDFGVAMAMDSAITDGRDIGPRLTGVGATLGTPAYSAPEQIEAAGEVDHRADLYSFGCVAYEMLTGSSPFFGRNLRDMLIAQVRDLPEPLERLRPTLPPAIQQIVMRCLEKEPAKRPHSASEIVKVLDTLSQTSINESGEVPAAVPPFARPATPAAAALKTQSVGSISTSPTHTALPVVALAIVLLAAAILLK